MKKILFLVLFVASVVSVKAQIYCTPSSTLGGTYIGSFSTTGGSTNITNNSGYSAGGYGAYTAMTVSQNIGSVINFSAIFEGSDAGFAIWVDWNHNGTFEAIERMYVSSGYAFDALGSFSVPATALGGNARMRIVAHHGEAIPSNPCENATRAEFEDYTVNVVTLTTCSGTPLGGTVSAITFSDCGHVGPMSITGATSATGITYQWYSSPDGNAPWTAVVGATGETYQPSDNRYFRRETKCTASGLLANSTSMLYNSLRPSNDECANATLLTLNPDNNCTTVTHGTVKCASPSPQPNTCTSGTADDDVWYKFVATSENHNISILNATGSSTNMFHSVYKGSCGALTKISCSDPNQNSLTGLTVGVTYYIRVHTYSPSAFTSDTEFDICLTTLPYTPSQPGNDCSSSIPFCTSTAYSFPANTTGAGYGHVGCLLTTPNPTWYYMEIEDPGNLVIQISGGSDVDFIAWGPFSSIENICPTIPMGSCGSCPNDNVIPPNNTFYPFGNIVDCAYWPQPIETLHINNALAGQVYVVLITNYSYATMDIQFQKISGTATTNCNIMSSPITSNSAICEGDTLRFYIPTPQAGATYLWTGPGGWSSAVMEPIRPASTVAMSGTYTMVETVGSVVSPAMTTEVVINAKATPVFSPVGPFCSGSTIPALPTSSVNGITGTWSPAINNDSTRTYTFTPAAGQCAIATTLQVVIDDHISPTFDPVGPYCKGAVIPPLPTTSLNNFTGTWSPAMDNTVTSSYKFTPTAGQCSDTTSITVNVIALNMNSITTLSDTCSRSLGSISIDVDSGLGSYSYQWSNAGANSNTITGLTLGDYIVTVTDSLGCQLIETIHVENVPLPILSVVNFTDDHCAQGIGTATVIATGGTGIYTYQWNTDPIQNTDFVSGLSAGSYIVQVNDEYCSNTLVVNVGNIPGPVAGASYRLKKQGEVNFIDLSSGATSWLWDFGEGSSSENQNSTHLYPEEGIYNVVLSVSDNFGCHDSTVINVVVEGEMEIWIPNAFTPDSDGKNDVFRPSGSRYSLDGYEMQIFDRWGGLVFKSNNFDVGWDGKMQGQALDVNGIFIYRIVIYNKKGNMMLYSGQVTILGSDPN